MKPITLQLMAYIRGPLGAEVIDFEWTDLCKPLIATYTTGDILVFYTDDLIDMHIKATYVIPIKKEIVGCTLVDEKYVAFITKSQISVHSFASIVVYDDDLKFEPTAIKYLENYKVLVVGFKKGFIRIYNWPMIKQYNDFYDCVIDTDPICSMELFNESYLLLATDGGHIYCINIIKIKNAEKAQLHNVKCEAVIKKIEGMSADQVEYNEKRMMQVG